MFGPPSPRFTQVCTLQGLIAQVLILRVANFQVLAEACIGKCQYWKSEGCARHLAKLRLRMFISPQLSAMRFVQDDALPIIASEAQRRLRFVMGLSRPSTPCLLSGRKQDLDAGAGMTKNTA